MNDIMYLKECIESRFPQAHSRLLPDESMAAHSSFKVGGAADLVFLIASADELIFAVQSAKKSNVPYIIIGNGSNILVCDGGIRGLVIIIGKDFAGITKESETVLVADAGALLSVIARTAANSGLSGLEFASGIPGSIGGAIYMNAGAYDGCMADVVFKTQGYDPLNDETFMLETPDSHAFGYRHSFYEQSGSIVLRAWMELKKGDITEIKDKMALFAQKRKDSQPLEFPSAGSTFKRPVGYFAGKLIEDAGMKGYRIGGACVSPKHAGFIVNDRNATAADVMELIKAVRDCVYKKSGVDIDLEIKIIGEIK
ncbi:MAG: UDP-N-acetylmuramate dehydrogenase [Saccharofermentanales bacterium]